MKTVARPKRLSQNDVIVLDDDSDSEQPAVKSARLKAEPVPSPEVIQLQQQVAELQERLRKSEENFQKAFTYGREARLRTEQVEKQRLEVECERAAAAEARKELVDVSTQLEKAMRIEKQMRNNNSELAREKDVLSAEVADLKRTVGQGTKDFLAMEERMQDRVNFLTTQLEGERSRAAEERMRDRARIEEMTYRLAQYDHWAYQQQQQAYPAAADWPELPTTQSESGQLPSLLQLPLPQPIIEVPIVEVPHSETVVVRIYDNEHPTNILQLYRAGMPKSVGLDSAVAQLSAKVKECGEDKLRAYLGGCESLALECEVCEQSFTEFGILAHFFSWQHVEKVRAHDAAVSLAAYQFWFRLLQQAAAAAAAQSMQQQAAAEETAAQQVAAATSSEGEEWAKKVKKEEPAE